MIVAISGSPDFMLANAKALEHSHLTIGELIRTILHEVELPLTLAKREGGAIFLDALKGAEFATPARTIGARIRQFFQVCSDKLGELTVASFRKCGACTNIERLTVKVIAHSGRCAFYQIAKLTERSAPAQDAAHIA